MDVTITRDHKPKTIKENRDGYMNKGDNQITKPISVTSLSPPPKEDQDSNDSDEADDSTGATIFDREKSYALYEDFEDTPS